MATARSVWFKGLLRHLPAVIGVALLCGAIYVVQKEFRHLKLSEISGALSGLPTHALALSFMWTVLSYFILTFYDRLGTIYAGHKVSYGRVAFASFCAYTLSHNLGFAAVSGAAVRFRLYAHWGLTPLQIGKTVAFCSFTFGLGGMVLGGLVLFLEADKLPFFPQVLPMWALYGLGAILWLLVLSYVSLARLVGRFRVFGHEIELPGFRMALLQVALATVDVLVTAFIFYALLPHTQNLTWLIFLGVYLAAYTAGLAANLPGGIGVFDTAMLLGLEPYVDAPHIVGAIIVFRLYYYIIPLFLAGSMFAGNEILLRGGSAIRYLARSSGALRWIEPDFAVAGTIGIVTLCGAMMLGIGVLFPESRFAWLDSELGGIAWNASEFIPSLVGAGLLLMAFGLSQRARLAWTLAMPLLIGGAIYVAFRDDMLWLGAVLAVSALLLAPFGPHFYRRAANLRGRLDATTAMSLIGLLICLIALAVTRPHARQLANDAWWNVILSPALPISLRLAVAASVMLALLTLWLLIRPVRVATHPWDATMRNHFASLGGVATLDAHGAVMGDGKQAVMPFRREGRLLVGLGDPVGRDEDRGSTIWRFHDLARQEGRGPAVWRAGPALLSLYADLGMTALPLGADGQPLPETPDVTPTVENYLVCMPENDLPLLLPLLANLPRQSRAPATERKAAE